MEINELYWDTFNKKIERVPNGQTTTLMKVAIEASKGELFNAMINNLSENIALIELRADPSRFKALAQCMIMNVKLICLGCSNE